jgi:hypothetical protein
MTDTNDPQRAPEVLISLTGVGDKGSDDVWRVDLSGLESGLTDEAVNLAQVDQVPPMRVIAENIRSGQRVAATGHWRANTARQESPPGRKPGRHPRQPSKAWGRTDPMSSFSADSLNRLEPAEAAAIQRAPAEYGHEPLREEDAALLTVRVKGASLPAAHGRALCQRVQVPSLRAALRLWPSLPETAALELSGGDAGLPASSPRDSRVNHPL